MHRSTVARLGLLALAWGSNFLWIKLAVRGLSPVEVTLARLVLGTGVLAALIAARRARLPRARSLWAHIVLAAVFANAIPYLLFAVGEQRVNSSTAGILNATTPLWTMAVALLTRHTRSLRAREAGGLAVGFGGVVLIFTPWRAAGALDLTGAAACLGAALSYGVGFVYMDHFLARRGASPLSLAGVQLLSATAMLAVVLPATSPPFPRLDMVTVVSVAVLGVAGTGFAYVVNYQIITTEGATVASMITYLLPVVAIGLGVAILGERLSVTDVAGVVLVLAGVALTGRRGRRSTGELPAGVHDGNGGRIGAP